MGGSQDWQGWAILRAYIGLIFFARLIFWKHAISNQQLGAEWHTWVWCWNFQWYVEVNIYVHFVLVYVLGVFEIMLEKPVRPTRIAKDSGTNRGHPQLFGPFFWGKEREEKRRRVMRVLPLTQNWKNKTNHAKQVKGISPHPDLKVRCVLTTHMKVICVLPLTFTSIWCTNRWWKWWRRIGVIFPWNLQCFLQFLEIWWVFCPPGFCRGGQGVQENSILRD